MNIFTKIQNYFVRHQIIENFHPSWFAMTMSWGVNAGLLHAMPFLPIDESVDPRGVENIRRFKNFLDVLCKIIWTTNSFYWILFMSISILQLVNHRKTIKHHIKPCFYGCMLMGFATCAQPLATLWNLPNLAATLYFIYFALTWILGIIINIRLIIHQDNRGQNVTSILLLPTLPNVVAAHTGASLIPLVVGPNSHLLKISLLFTAYISLGWGMLLAFLIIGMVFNNLFKDGFYPITSCHALWIICGPIGHSANSLIQLSRYVRDFEFLDQLTVSGNSSVFLEIFRENVIAGSFLASLLIWSFGIFWIFVCATSSLRNYFNSSESETTKPIFNTSYWSIIFPLATMTFATYQLTIVTDFMFFYVLSWIFTLIVLGLSLFVHARTIYAVIFTASEFWKFYSD